MHSRNVWRTTFVIIVAVILGMSLVSAALADDSPNGFWWGSDDNGPAPSSSANLCPSSSAPWLEPNTENNGCGHYGYYAGNVAGFQSLDGCGSGAVWNTTAAARVRENHDTEANVGAIAYYYGGGPGSDPNYDGTTSEAYSWGQKQGKAAVNAASGYSLSERLIVLDVEDGGFEGWNEVDVPGTCYTQKSSGIATSVDRATFNGFWDYVFHTANYFIGVYSSAGEWNSIFGSGSDADLTGTTEVTADWGGNCHRPAPQGWSQPSGNCAANSPTFYGGIGTGSDCAFGWQWSAGGDDYDQIDFNRFSLCN